LATENDILIAAFKVENDKRDLRSWQLRAWAREAVGASAADMRHLVDNGYVELKYDVPPVQRYLLSEKGRGTVARALVAAQRPHIPRERILEAMNLIVGYEDIKDAMANAVDRDQRVNFLLEGPAASAKSLFLEAHREAVPGSEEVFGSRTTPAGLWSLLFEKRPRMLFADEMDKFQPQAYSIFLGLAGERGELISTLSHNYSGVTLDCPVIAACNDSRKIPREVISRFLWIVLSPYTRTEFIDAAVGMLTVKSNCPRDIAQMIAEGIIDNQLGDIRTCNNTWKLMGAATEAEVKKAIEFQRHYSPDQNIRARRARIQQNAPRLL
jgi:hypothetical protein